MSAVLLLTWALRLTGFSLLVLSGLHLVFFRVFDWGGDAKQLTPLNRRVFFAHLFSVVFVLSALGVLLVSRPELLVRRSELARYLSAATLVFFVLRLLAQPLFFDDVLAIDWRWRTALRWLAMALWVFYTGVFAAAFAHQHDNSLPQPTPFDFHSPWTWVRIGIALVWLTFGGVLKGLNAAPRHRQIVARVLGESLAGPVIRLVAVGECGIGLWMLSGRWLVACVALQTVSLIAMNGLELRYARDLLLSPRGMVLANVGLVSLGWALALAT